MSLSFSSSLNKIMIIVNILPTYNVGLKLFFSWRFLWNSYTKIIAATKDNSTIMPMAGHSGVSGPVVHNKKVNMYK